MVKTPVTQWHTILRLAPLVDSHEVKEGKISEWGKGNYNYYNYKDCGISYLLLTVLETLKG